MFYTKDMEDTLTRLRLLSAEMSLEPAEESRPAIALEPGCLTPVRSPRDDRRRAAFIYPATLPNGQRIKLLKTQLSSACERDCYYCPFRAGRNFRRATFRPEEFARIFMQLFHSGVTEGLFLSSGLAGGGVRTQDRLIETAEILRFKLGFQGYIHLKIMPGAQRTQVERSMQLADRVSVNLEAPNSIRLARLAPHKQFTDELLEPLKWVAAVRKNQPAEKGWNGKWPSSVTQFVAGGSGESDLELLTATAYLYSRLGLKRAYFSPFNPVEDTPLENQPATPAIRTLRLYQASFLLRDYGFDLKDLPFESGGLLPVEMDPKQAWAWTHLRHQPVEVNRADRSELLRVPGIGPKSADAILRIRRSARIKEFSTLKMLGVLAKRAAPFLLLEGHRSAYQEYLI